MSKILETIMENEQIQEMINEAEDLITEAVEESVRFPKIIKSFILNHPEEFIGENIEDTKKNIRVFTEISTQEYFKAVSDIITESIISEMIEVEDSEDPIERYL